MWLYSGPEDTAWTHSEVVGEDTVAQWLPSITGNKDNPCEAKQILPFDAEHPPGEAFTNMYSPVPNGEPHHRRAESEGSDDIEYADDVSDDSNNDDEVESSPCFEHRSKQTEEPVADHGKAVALSVKTLKRTRTTTAEPSEKVAKQEKGCNFWCVPHGG
ncbi:hypothetical protein VPH35_127586 [Triticum aestivum]